jgi:hypothetical protein
MGKDHENSTGRHALEWNPFHERRSCGLSLRIVLVTAFFGMAGLSQAAGKTVSGGEHMSMQLTSAAFEPNGEIPAVYTCDGKDISPPLSWSGVPSGTRSLALIVDDPDAPDPKAPKMTWVHWVLYNLPPTSTGLKENVSTDELPPGTREGVNDWKRTGYGGPCPPIGRHRYFHKLYALDVELPDMNRPTKAELERAMQGHILEQAQLIGTYQHP